MQTLLEIIQALDATRLRHLSDLHLVADGRHATVYLCFAPPRSHLPTLAREVLPLASPSSCRRWPPVGSSTSSR